jgi:short subunit dehydrogenase-like uncharacterized protein
MLANEETKRYKMKRIRKEKKGEREKENERGKETKRIEKMTVWGQSTNHYVHSPFHIIDYLISTFIGNLLSSFH